MNKISIKYIDNITVTWEASKFPYRDKEKIIYNTLEDYWNKLEQLNKYFPIAYAIAYDKEENVVAVYSNKDI